MRKFSRGDFVKFKFSGAVGFVAGVFEGGEEIYVRLLTSGGYRHETFRPSDLAKPRRVPAWAARRLEVWKIRKEW